MRPRRRLFEANYKAILVHDDVYLRNLCRYIHNNPVRHGLVASPEDWPYSNYLEWIERRSGRLVERQFIGSYFPTAAAYEQFVREGFHGPLTAPPYLAELE